MINALIEPPDVERDRAALTRVLHAHGERDVRLEPRDVADLRSAADDLRRIMETREVDAAAGLLNDLLARTASRPHLSNHEGSPWHLHLTSPAAGAGEWLVATGALALADLLTRRGRPAWGRCAACPRCYVHDGRGSARLYCSPRCATRARVAAHRRRARST